MRRSYCPFYFFSSALRDLRSSDISVSSKPLNSIESRKTVISIVFSRNVVITTYFFHSALEGYKVGLIQKDDRASFEMDCKHELQYFEDKGCCTMAYESVIGRGHIRILSEEEKLPALKLLMAHYHKGKEMPFSTAAIPRTLVYALEVESITGKRKLPK